MNNGQPHERSEDASNRARIPKAKSDDLGSQWTIATKRQRECGPTESKLQKEPKFWKEEGRDMAGSGCGSTLDGEERDQPPWTSSGRAGSSGSIFGGTSSTTELSPSLWGSPGSEKSLSSGVDWGGAWSPAPLPPHTRPHANLLLLSEGIASPRAAVLIHWP